MFYYQRRILNVARRRPPAGSSPTADEYYVYRARYGRLTNDKPGDDDVIVVAPLAQPARHIIARNKIIITHHAVGGRRR